MLRLASYFWRGVALLVILAISRTDLTAEEPAKWRPELVAEVKAMTLEQLFEKYQAGFESLKRSQATYLREIMERPDLLQFLSAKLKKDRGVPDSKGRIEAREKAATILGKMGEKAKPAIPLLVEALEDKESVRHRVGNALAELGPVALAAREALLEELHFQNPLAARALFRMDPTSEEVLKAVIEAVSDHSKEQGFRYQTIEAFYECKVKSTRAKDFLGTLAKDNGNPLSQNAANVLQVLESRNARYVTEEAPKYTEKDIPSLVERLKANPNDYPATFELSKLGTKARAQTAEILLESLKRGTVRYPGNTISELGLCGKEAKPALPLLLQYASGDDAGAANNAMATIGEIGPEAIEAKPIVEPALEDGAKIMRWRAALTLCKIDPDRLESYLPKVVENFRGDTTILDYGLRSLGGFGPRASIVAPMLQIYLENDSTRLSAAEALLKIQPDRAEKIASVIVQDLKRESTFSKGRAAWLLGTIGPKARAALPELRSAAAGSDRDLAKIASEAIIKIETAKENK